MAYLLPFCHLQDKRPSPQGLEEECAPLGGGAHTACRRSTRHGGGAFHFGSGSRPALHWLQRTRKVPEAVAEEGGHPETARSRGEGGSGGDRAPCPAAAATEPRLTQDDVSSTHLSFWDILGPELEQ